MIQPPCKTSIDPVEVQIGSMIRMFRLMRGLSQQDLARSLGVTFQQVQKYEKARTHIASSRLYEIAGIVGAPIEIFFNGLESGKSPGTPVCEIVQRYRKLSPQPGLQEFMELNRAVVGISNREIRNAVLALMNNAASALDMKSLSKSAMEYREVRQPGPHACAAEPVNGRKHRRLEGTDNLTLGPAMPVENGDSIVRRTGAIDGLVNSGRGADSLKST